MYYRYRSGLVWCMLFWAAAVWLSVDLLSLVGFVWVWFAVAPWMFVDSQAALAWGPPAQTWSVPTCLTLFSALFLSVCVLHDANMALVPDMCFLVSFCIWVCTWGIFVFQLHLCGFCFAELFPGASFFSCLSSLCAWFSVCFTGMSGRCESEWPLSCSWCQIVSVLSALVEGNTCNIFP